MNKKTKYEYFRLTKEIWDEFLFFIPHMNFPYLNLRIEQGCFDNPNVADSIEKDWGFKEYTKKVYNGNMDGIIFSQIHGPDDYADDYGKRLWYRESADSYDIENDGLPPYIYPKRGFKKGMVCDELLDMLLNNFLESRGYFKEGWHWGSAWDPSIFDPKLCEEQFKPKEGFVYLIKNQDLHKIGHTKRLKARMEQLKPDAISKVSKVRDYKKLEKLLHKKFDEVRIPQTEYFRLTNEQILEAKEFMPNDYRYEYELS